MKNGFTLVELMITLLIAGIVAAFAIPSFTEIMQNKRAVAVKNRLIPFLRHPQATALRRDPWIHIGYLHHRSCLCLI